MKKSFTVLALLVVLVLVTSIPAFSENEYSITYMPNNCLRTVPKDTNTYKNGDSVTVLFDPVTYMNYLTFYGWSFSPNGPAEFGYSYNQFYMPDSDVTLYAICIGQSYNPAPARPWQQDRRHHFDDFHHPGYDNYWDCDCPDCCDGLNYPRLRGNCSFDDPWFNDYYFVQY